VRGDLDATLLATEPVLDPIRVGSRPSELPWVFRASIQRRKTLVRDAFNSAAISSKLSSRKKRSRKTSAEVGSANSNSSRIGTRWQSPAENPVADHNNPTNRLISECLDANYTGSPGGFPRPQIADDIRLFV
jgi:hypothetical protein